MSSILDIEFSSDDSEYEEDPRNLSGDESERKPSKRRIKRNVAKIFDKMESDSKKRYSVPQVRDSNDLMLQFHKIHDPEAKDLTKEGVIKNIEKCTSRICIESNPDHTIYKCSRDTSDTISPIKAIKSQSTGILKEIITPYKFAGKVYNLVSKVDENSKEYKRYLKSKETQVGGALSWLDNAVSGLESKKSMTAILKSQKDWEEFSKKYKLEDKLKQGHKFIKQTDFISKSEWLEHQVNLDKKH